MKQIQSSILTFLIAITFSCTAQELSLEQCKEMALRNNVKVQNAALDIESAKQLRNQALTKYFPDIKMAGGGYHALNPLFEIGIDNIENATVRNLLNTLYFEYGATLGIPNSFSMFKNGYTANLTAMQPLYAGGQINNGNRLAKLGIEAAEMQNEIAQQEVILQVEESYWLIISLQEKRNTARQALQLVDTLAHDVNGAYASGLVTQNDVLKVRLKQNELKSTLLKIDNGIALATMALCQVIGMEYSPEIVLTDSLSADIIAPDEQYIPSAEAVGNRPEAKLLSLQVKAEQLQRKMTLGETLPQVGLGASYGYGHLTEYSKNLNGLVFAMVQVPLSNWWESSYKLHAHKIRIQIAENNQRDLTEKMNLQTQQAWNELVETYQQILIADEMVENARQNLTLAEHNYQSGFITISELLESQTLLQQARDQQNDERINFQIKSTKYRQLTQQD